MPVSGCSGAGGNAYRVGVHLIWLVFLLSYASRIPDPARMHIGLVFTPLALAALGLRLAARWSARRRRTGGDALQA